MLDSSWSLYRCVQGDAQANFISFLNLHKLHKAIFALHALRESNLSLCAPPEHKPGTRRPELLLGQRTRRTKHGHVPHVPKAINILSLIPGNGSSPGLAHVRPEIPMNVSPPRNVSRQHHKSFCLAMTSPKQKPL